ncbi:PHP domain-containing protein [Martelella lutilitoris]|uniref:PHP domain-containing protein n=1 Tax=Martelella lutilitoris TaxID=2583532 RepID=A0A5C4JPW0_9HYPH|nr:PHP domain-containing protein [Martelella lutilitoris]
MTGPRYAELQVTTHFSFLRGASSCDELFARAADLGIEAIGVVDRNSLAGVVRAFEASRQTGVRLVVGYRSLPQPQGARPALCQNRPSRNPFRNPWRPAGKWSRITAIWV